jgi:seryl-tRNA synthetase
MTPPSLHRVLLDPPVPAAQGEELSKRVFFVSDAILDFSLVRGGVGISAVDVTTRAGLDPDELARKLRLVVSNEVLPQRLREETPLWSRPPLREPAVVFERLLREGIAFEVGEGQVAVGEPVLSLMDVLDARIRAFTTAEFGARELRYPTLIPTRALSRCKYFQSFPQLMMLVTRVHGDVETYRGLVERLNHGGDLETELREHCDNFDYCLPPTMCFHTYHQLSDRPLPARTLVVTSRGKSFRFESRYRRALERLWDFTIREIVFLGARDFVLDCRRRFMERSFELIESLLLGGQCSVANDPFFAGADTAERTWSQRLLELKYELRLPIAADADVAVASFNFHEQFFGDSFRIRDQDEDEFVHTACVGFGLERLAYAFLCQHGLNPADWPGDVAVAIRA